MLRVLLPTILLVGITKFLIHMNILKHNSASYIKTYIIHIHYNNVHLVYTYRLGIPRCILYTVYTTWIRKYY